MNCLVFKTCYLLKSWAFPTIKKSNFNILNPFYIFALCNLVDLNHTQTVSLFSAIHSFRLVFNIYLQTISSLKR